MENISPYVPELLRLVNRTYPDWEGFNDPGFIQDEISYKREAAQMAQDLLNNEALENLLEAIS